MKITYDAQQPDIPTRTFSGYTVEETQKSEDEMLYESFKGILDYSKDQPTLPMWFVMDAPAWMVDFAFWIKGIFR